MSCVICKHGRLDPGTTTVTLQRGNSTIIFKDVPADICDNCGEYYLTSEISDRLLKAADASARSGTEVEILRFAA